ncbi:MAG: carboxypeptidase-like regulatory domain-containing protein [Bacteroidota bacterium]
MRAALVAVFIFSISLPVFSQDEYVEIIGEIIDSEKREAVPYVHVVNDQLKLGTVSNTEGRFWIKMQQEDTLKFSAIGFETFVFTLKDDVATDKLMVTIELNLATMELQPVKVFAFRNEEALKQALLDTEVPLEEQQRGIQLPGFYYGPTKEVKPSPFGNPISFIASKFSREEKEKKMVAKYQKQVDYQKQIRAKYNQSVVIELTGLPEDKVEEFMEFCKLNDGFLGPASEYEIAIAVNKCLVDFQATTPIDSLPKSNEN